MTFNQAMRAAERKAKARGKTYYVVFEAGEYDTASDYDLDTFYLGKEPVAVAEPDGETIIAEA